MPITGSDKVGVNDRRATGGEGSGAPGSEAGRGKSGTRNSIGDIGHGTAESVADGGERGKGFRVSDGGCGKTEPGAYGANGDSGGIVGVTGREMGAGSADHRADAGVALIRAGSPGWLAYQQFLDSALPIGGFSHSFGLETLVQEGIVATPSELKDYLTTMLRHNWASADAMAVCAVYRYAPQEQWELLWDVDRMLHAQRAALESRLGTQKMGNRLYKLARQMYPALGWEPLSGALEQGGVPGTHALLHGWVAWRLGVPERQAAEGYLYACTVTGINSALRLMSIGQTQGQALVAELLPLIAEACRDVETMDPLDAYTCTPAADIAMMRHETLYSRLFMS